MSAEDRENTDQDIAKSVRELTAIVQDLRNVISSQHNNSDPNKVRAELKEKDEVVKAIHEQRSNGQPEKIDDWKEVELMPVDKIEEKNKKYTQRYEDSWKDIDQSTESEKEAATKAYTSAFGRFYDIYRLLGWNNKNHEDALFDESTLTESRDLLIESIFGIEVYQMSHFGDSPERSRALFELSRLPRLLVILVRIACRQIYIISACGADKRMDERPFDASTTVNVLAHVARSMPYVRSNPITMDKLLRQCYKRRILSQPSASDVHTHYRQFDLIYDCLTALDFTGKFRELRDPLCAGFYMKHKSETINTILEHVKAHSAAIIGINPFPELPLEENTSPVFQPEIFSVQYLLDFGRLKIEWTDCLDEHLKIYARRNAIRIFAHPTFFYNNLDLNKDARDYMDPTYRELALTYALLFRPTSCEKLKSLKHYVTAGKDQQLPWHKCVTFNGRPFHRFIPPWDNEEVPDTLKILDIKPSQNPTKEILSESFYRCSIPPSTQIAFNIGNQSGAVKKIDKTLDQHRVTSTSMRAIVQLAPNYPEDIKFMITAAMEADFADTESFLTFPYFAPRLRRLKTYLESRQPTIIRELWYDRRDFRSWCILWGAAVFAVCVSGLLVAILNVQRSIETKLLRKR